MSRSKLNNLLNEVRKRAETTQRCPIGSEASVSSENWVYWVPRDEFTIYMGDAEMYVEQMMVMR